MNQRIKGHILFFIWIAVVISAIAFGIWYLSAWYSSTFIVNGQETTTNNKAPPITTPTPVITPTPTSPNPNLQYLPQKSYVQTFAPENGIPQPAIPLTALPQTLPPAPSAAPVQSNILDQFGGVAGILAMAGAAGVYVKTHLLGNKTKEVMAAEVKTKEQVGQLARVTYDMNPEKAAQITDAPAIQLKKLDEDKAEFSEKATKA